MKFICTFLFYTLFSGFLFSQSFLVDTIQYVGDPELTYDLIIMAEGYTEDQLNNFRNDAVKVKEVLELNDAYKAVFDKMNIFSVSTESEESGISLISITPTPNDPIQTTEFKSTFFSIYYLNSYRAYFLEDSTILKAKRVAANIIPYSDVVLILTNDTNTSGRASFEGVAVASRFTGDLVASNFSAYVINHELAHSIAGLSDAYSFTKEEGFNKSTNKDPNTIRWKDLLHLEDVSIDSVTTGVYIPNQLCMMISPVADFTCPVCSQRIRKVISEVEFKLPTPHRIWYVGQDDTKNTMTFGWDPVEGATKYEVVFHAYLQGEIFFTQTDTNQVTFSLEQEMMSKNYFRSISLRAYNDSISTYYTRYSTHYDANFSKPVTVPGNIVVNQIDGTHYTIGWTQNSTTKGTMIRLFNEDGLLSEIYSDNNSISLNGLKDGKEYYFQLAAVYPEDLEMSNSSAFTELMKLAPCGIVEVSSSVTTCGSYISPQGKEYSESGIYRDTVLKSSGCDSVYILDITILPHSEYNISVANCLSYFTPSGKFLTTSGIYHDTIPNHLGCDSIMIIDLIILENSEANIEITTCGSYFASNGITYDSSALISYTTGNAAGCDSMVHINLTIRNIEATIIEIGSILTAGYDHATYQWLDCNTSTVISGATNQQFTPVAVGDFAVIITDGECADTSACFSIVSTPANQYSLNQAINLYPNPTADLLYIDFSIPFPILTLEILNTSGHLVKKVAYQPGQDLIMNVGELVSGVYFVHLITPAKKYIQKLFKQ